MRVFVLAGLVFALVFSLASFEAARGETLMQCMEKCISYEGGNSATNKATCKSRCGAGLVKQKPAGMRNCMGEVKSCRSKCGKEEIGNPNACHKKCKALQMNCN